MKTKLAIKIIKRAALLLLLSTFNFQLSTVLAQGTAFTYQGRLNNGSSPANGSYDLTFTLFSVNSGGSSLAGPVTNSATTVSNGLFTTMVDFGPGVFTGTSNWLEIAVRTNGGGGFTTLAPRQQLTPVPYAIFAGTASNLLGVLPAGQLSGTIPNGNLPASPVFTGTVAANALTGNGLGVTNVNATSLNGMTAGNFWQTGGNNVSGGQFLGSTNNQPVEIWVNNARVMRYEPGVAGEAAPNVIGGSSANFVGNGVTGAVIGGGGATNYQGVGYTNEVLADFGVIAGGGANIVPLGSVGSTVGGGVYNVAGGTNAPYAVASTVAGGAVNSALAPYAEIGGGAFNTNQAFASAIGGGWQNTILAGANYSLIGGGYQNTNGGLYSLAGGGFQNQILTNGTVATIGGGAYNIGGSFGSTIGGGQYNHVTNNAGYEAIGGGLLNSVIGFAGTVPGGRENMAGVYSLAAGFDAQATNAGSFVWADDSGFEVPFGSLKDNSFSVRANGGVRFVTSGAGITADGLPLLVSGGGSGITIQPNSSGAPDIIEGSPVNYVAGGVIGATIGGGGATNYAGVPRTNSVSADFGVIGGGIGNSIQPNALASFLGSGYYNSIQTNCSESVLVGGFGNIIWPFSDLSVLVGGQNNSILSGNTFLGGGFGNSIETNSAFSVLVGGSGNSILPNAGYSFLGGGSGNSILNATDAILGGGSGNNIQSNATYAVLGGGGNNSIQANAIGSFLGGGYNNLVTNSYATVPGGAGNMAGGMFSFAVGQRAKAVHQGAFVWADSQAADFASSASDQFNVRAQGGVRLVTSGAGILVDGQPVLTGGPGNVNLGTNSSMAGGLANTIQNGADRSTISGGNGNQIGASAGATIGGGVANVVGTNATCATIAGGNFNTIANNATLATIGGGFFNTNGGTESTVAGGWGNTIQSGADRSTISGGNGNVIDPAIGATIGGGVASVIGTNASCATIAGGNFNTVLNGAGQAAIGGGLFNTNGGFAATVPGGYLNLASGNYSFAAGNSAQALHNGAFVWADSLGVPFSSTTANQFLLRARGGVGIDTTSTPEGNFCVNTNSYLFSHAMYLRGETGSDHNHGLAYNGNTVTNFGNGNAQVDGPVLWGFAGGALGTASGGQVPVLTWSPANVNVLGALTTSGTLTVNTNINVANNFFANVPLLAVSGQRQGGFGNAVAMFQNLYSSFAPSAAPALRVVASGATLNGALSVSAQGTGLIAQFGNAGGFVADIQTNGAIDALTFNSTSDRNAKENVARVDTKAVLERVATLPISEWNYKTVEGVRHIGPMAQDFQAAFGLNGNDDKHIATVDADGVALAAIQGLNEKLEDRSQNAESKIQKLEANLEQKETEIAELKQTVIELKELVQMMNQKPNGGER
ncbi:MAG TPA: tail fiber domain-containing protein [Candidatus Acidoferrum sp.]|nr:tail fiber domain-containing protein [Candidatus Acidoferrum sp.]